MFVCMCEFIVVLLAINSSQIENILSRKFIYYTYPTKHNSSAEPTSEVLRTFTLACSYRKVDCLLPCAEYCRDNKHEVTGTVCFCDAYTVKILHHPKSEALCSTYSSSDTR